MNRFLIILLVCAGTAEAVDFERDIQPIFAEHCLGCHGPDKSKGGLRLSTPADAFAELKSGARAIVPGDPATSELLVRVSSHDLEERMPPKTKAPLRSTQIEALKQWIAGEAPWPTHWAYRPVKRPPLPALEETDGVRNPIDRFIRAPLEALQITPSAEADPHTLIRRVYFDLLGLPPAPEEIAAFVDDPSPEAYDRLLDRAFASPHFGERWGRHWLDQARYADSDGYEKDKPRPDAWRYRDWVIDAVNGDLPFDQFTFEQLAGDLLPNSTPQQKLATAFHRQTLTNEEGGVDKEQFRVEAVFDRTETTGTIWLGLTIGCARCHSHKYDQISQREYYGLFAFFNDADETTTQVPRSIDAWRRYEREENAYNQRIRALEAEYASEELATVRTLNPIPPLVDARVLTRAAKPRATKVLRRGDFLSPTDAVSCGVPATLPRLQPRTGAMADRLDLARWLVSPEHPLTARVVVNGFWLKLFGEGLVRTPNDFGVRGERPTHPELLDWLADEFVRGRWSRKKLLHLIMSSATYRQQSVHRTELVDRDPQNRLFHRQNRLRIEAELVRDLHLATSGLLARQIGGPSVFPPMPAEIAALSYANNFKWVESKTTDRYRRGMYTFFKRTAPHPDLMIFDCPDANTTATARNISNTPLQALLTLNGPVFAETARALAQRVIAESEDDRARIARAFALCVARPPRDEEVETLLALLQQTRAFYRAKPEQAATMITPAPNLAAAHEIAAWSATMRILMNTDEFITRE